jgi:serine/threonine protein kinase
MVEIWRCRKARLPCIHRGYTFATDAYSVGVLFGQLIYGHVEEDVTDDDNTAAKGPAYRRRAMEEIDAMHGQGTTPSFDPRGLEVVVCLLATDPAERMTVLEAVAHEYFNDCQYEPYEGVVRPRKEVDEDGEAEAEGGTEAM